MGGMECYHLTHTFIRRMHLINSSDKNFPSPTFGRASTADISPCFVAMQGSFSAVDVQAVVQHKLACRSEVIRCE